MAATAKPKSVHASGWTLPVRIAVSVLICLHLLAVITAPWAAPPPASELARWTAGWFRPYAEAIFINNGYRYFAPEPGPSHLVRYEVTKRDGSIVTGRFPDRQLQWPRLLYHRHFMLAEMTFHLTSLVPDLPPDIPASRLMSTEEEREYRDLRQQSQLLPQSIADYLHSQIPQSETVKLYLQLHHIPTPQDLDRGLEWTDPRTYEERLLGEFPQVKP